MASLDEDAQVEALRRWWSDNWKALVAGLVIGLIGIFGWRFWQSYQVKQQQQASALYQNMNQAMSGKKNGDIKGLANQLKQNYGSTPYAAAAQLKLAQASLANGRLADAAKSLKWVAYHADDKGIRAIAKLRLAAIEWQQGKDEAALKLLQNPLPSFAALYAEQRGDILLDQKKLEQAQQAYAQALAELPSDSAERTTVQQKLDSLAGAATRKS